MRLDRLTAQPYEGYHPVGIYGWRKRCLYAFILMLMVIVVMNLALTVWILRVLDFSIDGMGKLRILKKGIQVEGKAEFLDSIYTSRINSLENQSLHVESSRNVTIQARNENKEITNTFIIGNKKIESICEKFEVRDKKGNERLLITDDSIHLTLDELIHKGKTVFDGSVETPALRGPPGKPLEVEAPETFVKLAGHQGVIVLAADGKVEFRSPEEVSFQSEDGEITLEAKNIYLKKIEVSRPSLSGRHYPNVYQLCVCENGRLFLGNPSGGCEASLDICRR